jgi:hypothetical protein
LLALLSGVGLPAYFTDELAAHAGVRLEQHCELAQDAGRRIPAAPRPGSHGSFIDPHGPRHRRKPSLSPQGQTDASD